MINILNKIGISYFKVKMHLVELLNTWILMAILPRIFDLFPKLFIFFPGVKFRDM